MIICKDCKTATEDTRADQKYLCRSCARLRQKKSRAGRKEQHALWSKINRLKKEYGLSLTAHDAMLSQQNGRCKICYEASPLVVDHCHKTGKVRGLLCEPCNRGLGHFKDEPRRLIAAKMYLEQS